MGFEIFDIVPIVIIGAGVVVGYVLGWLQASGDRKKRERMFGRRS